MRKQWLFLSFVVALVAYLALMPLAMLLYGSFKSTPPGVPGALTLAHYGELFKGLEMADSFKNSIVFSFWSSLLGFVGAIYLAWMTERTNMVFKRLVYACIIVPLVVPGILTTIGWIMLLSRRSGPINLLASNLFGVDGLFSIYNMAGMIWVFGIDHIPLSFLLLVAAFRSMDPSLEEASMVAGAGIVRTTCNITLKILLPATLAVWIINFVRALENFEVPALIGIPAGIMVFATEVYLATNKVPTDFAQASTYATVYLALTAVGVVLYLRATAASERFTTITGKGYRPAAFNLRSWRYLLSFLTLLVCIVLFIFPLLTIIWSSFLPYYMAPSRDALHSLTLENYKNLFSLPLIYRAFWNSFVLGISSATIVMLLTAVIAWIVVRTQWHGKGLLDFLAFSPIAIPGLVLGIALMWTYLTLPIPIYGTLWILLLAYVIKYLPYGMRASSFSMHQIHKELEEASETCGSTWAATFFRIVLPLLLPGFIAGWIYVIAHSFRELSTSILLYRSGTEVLSVVIFELWDAGQYPELSALGLTLVAILVTISSIAKWMGDRFAVQPV
jgi:iron(III) transport system permease protein